MEVGWCLKAGFISGQNVESTNDSRKETNKLFDNNSRLSIPSQSKRNLDSQIMTM